MKEEVVKLKRKTRRSVRIRRKLLQGVRPRLTVFRSNKYIYAQIIEDKSGKTLVSVSEKEINVDKKSNKIDMAENVGRVIAQKAADKKVKEVVFDKGSYKYHGRVKALAEGARKEGLVF